ncbi:unnamed protein product [Nyctereutes procyonoides]|uniref:Swi5-dependent recombination DNA repair protein 1 homolog n=1 Tax=Nyctereutes procyonoides TaxID=34880 RepID=A0A811Y5D9_NYCPR|nr:unnamed protein product [Nyctereutes procyonoides]
MESPSDSAVILASTPQDYANPLAALRECLRKTRSSFNSCYSVMFSEKPASSIEENCLVFRENFKHTDSEFEEIYLKNTFKNVKKKISACETESLDTEACSDLQSDIVNDLPKRGLSEEKAKLDKQIEEKEHRLQRLKLVKNLQLKDFVSAMFEEKKSSLTQLIDHYGLDDKLLHYNRNEDEFMGV